MRPEEALKAAEDLEAFAREAREQGRTIVMHDTERVVAVASQVAGVIRLLIQERASGA